MFLRLLPVIFVRHPQFFSSHLAEISLSDFHLVPAFSALVGKTSLLDWIEVCFSALFLVGRSRQFKPLWEHQLAHPCGPLRTEHLFWAENISRLLRLLCVSWGQSSPINCLQTSFSNSVLPSVSQRYTPHVSGEYCLFNFSAFPYNFF